MLQILRNKAQSIVIQAIVVIIALVFIFWGVGANLMNNREAALVINDEEISFEDFQKAYERTYANFQEQFGGNIPQGLFDGAVIKQQVANQLIQSSLLRQGALEMGLMISPAEIQDTVENMIQFQDDGSFNLEKYRSILATNGYSPHKFENSLRYDMLAQRTSLDIQNFATAATDFEIHELYRMEKTTVAVNFVRISPTDLQDSITPTDEELRTWFTSVQENYKTDPLLKLKYLSFTYSDIGRKVAIDEANVQDHYKSKLSSFTTPEQRRARHILFKVDDKSSSSVQADQLKKAENVLKLANSGEDFAKLAEKFSEGPSKASGGDLGFFSQGRMVKSFDETVFSMQPKEISNIIKTEFGFHIIKLEEIQPSTTKSLEEVHDTIVAELQTEQAKPIAFQLANEAYENIISAGSLQAYMEQHPDAELKQTDFFSHNTPPAEIRNDQKFLTTAFTLRKGELSSLFESSAGYAILYAEDITPPATPPLKDVKKEVISDYKQEKALETAQKRAADLLARAKEAGNLQKAAEESQLKLENSGLMAKNGAQQYSSFPASLKEEAFQLSTKSPLPEEPGAAEGNFFVFQFAERKTPEASLSDTEKNLYKETLLKFKQQQLLSAWLQEQENNAKIMSHKNL